jgi:predicted nucleotidyltransferase
LKVVGIICEYNPFHRGHHKQIRWIKEKFGNDAAVVCLMSGNYVQRGYPAIVDKTLRARAAVLSGADLVLELPTPYVLSSAEGFAAGGVSILGSFCDYLCFGSESGDAASLMHAAGILLSQEFPPLLRSKLNEGISFPAARQAALEALGADPELVLRPNNILAVEYCKAILAQHSAMEPLVIIREGSYHAKEADAENPSATAVRAAMEAGLPWASFVPDSFLLEDAAIHTLQAGQRAILAKLRTMEEAEFAALPYGGEGLWRKLMHACRRETNLEAIIAATKSKRYTRTRLDRMILCAYLGITAADLQTEVPYVRVLGFTGKGRSILARQRKTEYLRNIGEDTRHPHQALEHRCTALYGLFADHPENPEAESHYRVIIK